MYWFHLQKVTNAPPAAEEEDDDDDDDEEGGDLSKYNLDDEVQFNKIFKPRYLFEQHCDVTFVNFLSSLSCLYSLTKLHNKPYFSEFFQKLWLSK